jgi:hypothetical protein
MALDIANKMHKNYFKILKKAITYFYKLRHFFEKKNIFLSRRENRQNPRCPAIQNLCTAPPAGRGDTATHPSLMRTNYRLASQSGNDDNSTYCGAIANNHSDLISVTVRI